MKVVSRQSVVIDLRFPDVSFEIEGKKYRLHYGFEEIGIIQEATGINLITDKWDLTVLNLIALLSAGVRRHHPEVTFEDVESWVTVKNCQLLYRLVLQALEESVPEPDKEAVGESSDPPRA